MAITPVSDKAFVVMACCQKAKKDFGITIDKKSPVLHRMIWAFKLDREKARREGYDSKTISGGLEADKNYPGCPYCGKKQIVFCSCGSIVCWDGESLFHCPVCGVKGEVGYVESVNIKGGAL